MGANRFVTTADSALKLEVIASPADPAKSYTAKSCTNELVHDAMKV